jgi:DNA-binding NarL/FixJ family response regulator
VSPGVPELVGRERELRALAEFLEGPPGTLVLEGEPGIGKTVLWRHALREAEARGHRVLQSEPAASETALPLIGLRDLLGGAVDELGTLPPPQRRALDVALLREEPAEGASGQATLSTAFTEGLRLLAARGPVLVAVDDLHWLDADSAHLLEFAARRLDEAPVRMLLTVRTGEEALSGFEHALRDRLQRMTVGPLSLGALAAVLRDRVDRSFPRPLLVRIHDASGGNPFFAVEIGRALAARGEQTHPGEPLPLPSTLAELVSGRIERLPAETQEAMLVAALLSEPMVDVLSDAIAVDAEAALDAAVAERLVELERDRIQFLHPLIAAAVHSQATRSRLRSLHRTLADVVSDDQQRAYHLAAAASGPDAAVAASLEEAALSARTRGAPAVAASLAERAVELTPVRSRGDRLRRTIHAARFAMDSGDAAHAREQLERAAVGPLPREVRAEVLLRLAGVNAFEADLPTAARLYEEAIALADQGSLVRAEAEEELAVVRLRSLADVPAAARLAASAASLAEKLCDERGLSEFLSTSALLEALVGSPQATVVMERAEELDRVADERALPSGRYLRSLMDAGFKAAVVRAVTDDLEAARRGLAAARQNAVEQGDDGSLPLILRFCAYVEWLRGDWSTAAALVEEGYELALQAGQPSQQALHAGTKALLHAHLGDGGAARSMADEALRLAEATGAEGAALLARAALGTLELSLGRPDAAVEHLAPVTERVQEAGIGEPGALFFVPDHVEALTSLRQLDGAEALLAWYQELAGRAGRESALATCARCRGLVAAVRGDVEEAVQALDTALAHHDRVDVPFARARTLLVKGRMQRRLRQRRASRATLSEALSTFDGLGATLWAAQARSELGSGRREPGAELTPAERRVAEQAAAGRSNRDIAAVLVVSPKTVEFHLSNVYRKLGVRSRTALAKKLANSGEEGTRD